jgi:tRNA A-37 threonylcarbamoyl transferase component Bud32
LNVPPSGFSVGALFAGFRIEEVLGSGGMGTVYRVLDINLDRERALKVLTPDLTSNRVFRERFQRESRLAAQLEEEGVVPIYAAGEADGRLYIAMRLVRGPDLHRLVVERGPLSLARTAAITASVARALDAAHERGIVHRDVKPANVLIERPGRDERVFLTDFGISRPDTETTSITSTGQLLGTPDYISPEQIDGAKADARADVYALGCVVSFLLTGEAPFHRDSAVATLYAHGHAERPRPSERVAELPEAVDELLARATAVDPGDRLTSAGELAGELIDAVDPAQRPVGRTAPVTPRTRELPGSSGPRRRWLAAAGAAVLVLAAVAAVVLIVSGDDGDPAAGVETVGVGATVDSVVVGEVNVLVASNDDNSLITLDPDTGEPGDDPRQVNHPTAVAVGYGSVWVTSGNTRMLLRYARGHDEPTGIRVGAEPTDVAVEDSAWVTNRDDATVTQIDPPLNQPVATIEVAPRPQSVAAQDDVAWIASASGTLTRVDAAGDGEPVAQPFQIGGAPADLAIVDGSLWVVDPNQGTLTERSLEDASEIRTIELEGKPVAIAVGPGALWVADKARDRVIRVDPDGDDETERYEVGKRPVAIAVGGGSVWVANAGDESVTRIVR